jgi:hypothetical protein
MFELPTLSFGKKKKGAVGHLYHPVRLAYEPANSIFLSEQNSHQQLVSSTFLSEQICTGHQPLAKRTRCTSPDPRSTPQIVGGNNIGGGGLQAVGAEASACPACRRSDLPRHAAGRTAGRAGATGGMSAEV